MAAAAIGLAILAWAEVPQVMSAYLPSPSTAYKDAANPQRIKWLKRHAIEGSIVAMSIAGAASVLAASTFGAGAWFIFIGAAVVLGSFLWEYNYAITCGAKEGNRYRE